jgi:hypothetical protein
MTNTTDVTDGKSIAVLLQSGVSAINPLAAFYDIHGGKREVLFFYFVPDTTRDFYIIHVIYIKTFLMNHYLLETPHLKPSGNYKDISIHRDRQRKAALLILCYEYDIQISPFCFNNVLSKNTYIHTYIPLKLYPRRGSRGISDIPLRHPRFTKMS